MDRGVFMEKVQTTEIKKTLESFLKLFDEYKDEIISERPQRNRLDELRKELQIKEPQITGHILNILGNGSVVIRSYGSQATIPYADLLATALMGGNNELRHNFGDFHAPVTSILNRAIGKIKEGLWPPQERVMSEESFEPSKSLLSIENMISDLEVLSEKCERDIGKKEIWNTPYYVDEFNSILDQAKKYYPTRCVDISHVEISDLSREGFKRGSVPAGDAAILNIVDAQVSKLLGRLSDKETTRINVVHGSLNKKKVFVVHGRNEQLLNSMFQFLDAIGLEPIEWNKAIAMTGKPSPTVPEIVSTAFREAQAIVVLFSGDDWAMLRKEFIQEHDEAYENALTPQARPNVLFEAGQAMAGSQERTVLVQVGKIRKFSDIQGLHITHLDNSTQKRQELITKLRNAKCDIRDLSAENRWMKVGNFEDKVDPSIIGKKLQKENLASEADDVFAKIKRTKIVRTKEGIPESLMRLESGQELTSLVEGCYAGSFYNDDPSTQTEVDLISGFFRSVQDFMDSLPDVAPNTRVQYEFDLTTAIHELEDEGFVVYGGVEIRRIEDGISKPEPFHVAIIKVQRIRRI